MMNLSDIDLNLLVVLDALLREEHVTHAGERLGLSQSATSRALKKLRVLFDDDLLIKGHQGMNLSPKATQLRPAVAQALEHLHHLFTPLPSFEPSTFEGTIRLSVGPWVPDTISTSWICAMKQDAPRMQPACVRTPAPSAQAHLDLRWGTTRPTSQSEGLDHSQWAVIQALNAPHKLEDVLDMVSGTTWVGARHHDFMVSGTIALEASTSDQVYDVALHTGYPAIVLEKDLVTQASFDSWRKVMVPDTTTTLWLSWCQAPSPSIQDWIRRNLVDSLN